MATDRQSSQPHGEDRIIVGREREQSRLSDLLSGALNGVGNLALISGEAGIGKTTLVRDLIQQAEERGALVLSGGCYDLTATPPYGPWSEAIRGYGLIGDRPAVPDWFEAPREPGRVESQAALFEEARGFFASIAAQQPLLIVLEDLHWSDSASLELLRYLARTLIESVVLLAVTYRDDEITRRHTLYQLLPILVRESRSQRIHLNRLDREAVRELVQRFYELDVVDSERLVDHVAGRSEGNPFFVGEILQGFMDEQILRTTAHGWVLGDLGQFHVPRLLRQVLDARLDRLSSETRSALQVAAVVGQDVALDLWQAVADLDDPQLDQVVAEALEMRLLEETTDMASLTFRHALLREAFHESIVLSQRRALHRQVGEALAESANPNPDAVAHHFLEASDPRAVAWFVRAGLRAHGSEAWLTASERLVTAAELLEADNARAQERGWLLFLAGFLLRHSNEPHVIDTLDEAERVGIVVADPVLSAYARYARGARRSTRGDIRRGVRELEEAVEAIDGLLGTHYPLDTHRQAASVIQRLLPDAERDISLQRTSHDLDEPRINHQRSVLINWIAHTGRFREAVAMGESYLGVMSAAFGSDYLRMPQIVSCLHGMGLTCGGLGRPEDARRHFSLDRAIGTAISDHAVVEQSIYSELLMALIPYQTDQLTERSRLLEDAARAWDRCRGTTITTAGDGPPSELQIDVLEGHWRKARQLATDHLSGAWIVHIQGGIVTLGILDRHQGKPDDAWQRVAELLPEGPATEPGDCYFPHVIVAIELAAVLALDSRNIAKAQRWIETHARWLEWSGAVLWQADNQLLRTRLDVLSGNLDRAGQHARKSLDLASDPRQPLALAAAHRMLGQLATTQQRFDTAEIHLSQSLDLAEACAAPFERALTLLALAELQIATGRPDTAQALLEQARAVCTPLEARPTLERIEAIEHQIHAQTSTPVDPHGLTPRETEVLRLIAAGKSNREIAEALFLSPRTVERHIANIYLKIDVHTKAEAAAYARRHRLA